MLGLISLARNDIREYGYLYTVADPGVVPGVPTTLGSKDDHGDLYLSRSRNNPNEVLSFLCEVLPSH